MDLADDVSYSVHDVEDAIVGARLDLSVLDDADERARVSGQVHAWYGLVVPDDALEEAMLRLPGTASWVRGHDGSRRALAALKDLTSELIGRFCGAAIDATRERHGSGPLTRYAADLAVPEATVAEILVLKGLAVTYVMAPRESEPLHLRQRQMIADLVGVLAERGPDLLEPPFAADWAAAPDAAARLRVVVDQVASLTDVSAAEWHVRLVRAPRHG